MSPTAGLLVRLAGAFDLTLAGLLLRAEGEGGRLSRAAGQPVWRDPATGYLRRRCSAGPTIRWSSPGSSCLAAGAWRFRPRRTRISARRSGCWPAAGHRGGRRAACAGSRRLPRRSGRRAR